MATVIEGDPKAPFSIATTPRYRRGNYSFPWIAPLYPWYIPYDAVLSKEVSSTILLRLWYDSTWDWTPVFLAIGKHSTHFIIIISNLKNSGMHSLFPSWFQDIYISHAFFDFAFPTLKNFRIRKSDPLWYHNTSTHHSISPMHDI